MIGRILYGAMKPVSCWALDEDEDFNGELQTKNMLKHASDVDGKDVPSSCFGVVFRMKRKVFFIYGSRRQQQKNTPLKKKLTKSMRH